MQIEKIRGVEQTDAGDERMTKKANVGPTWFSIPAASEPTLVADQEFVLYR
jgi:hypothetical protein